MQTNIVIDTNKNSALMESVRNFKIEGGVYREEIIEILKSNTVKSKHQKIKIFGEVWWHEIEEIINEEPKNNKITSVHFDYIDRGVQDWVKFETLLRSKYKNLKNISFAQLFGHIGVSNFELVILHDREKTGFHRSNVLFFKEFLQKDDDYYLVVTKSNFVYISDKRPDII